MEIREDDARGRSVMLHQAEETAAIAVRVRLGIRQLDSLARRAWRGQAAAEYEATVDHLRHDLERALSLLDRGVEVLRGGGVGGAAR